MAILCFNDAYVELATVDYSSYVKSVTINYSAEMLEATSMGDTTHAKHPGLQAWTVDIEFYNDFADDGMDETLQALTGTEVAMVIRPVESAIVSGDNPEYQMTGLLDSWPPVGGSVGEMSMVRAHFVAASTITRAVA